MTFPKIIQEDRALLIITITLVAAGLIMVYSASWGIGLHDHDDSTYFLKRQAIWVGLGLTAMYFSWRTDISFYRKAALPALALVFIMLALVLVPGVGATVNGAKRWFRLGSLSLQPSEFLKPALIVALAASLSKRAALVDDFVKWVLPYILLTGTAVCLVGLEPDFGAAAAISAVVMLMLYFSGAKLKWLMAPVILAAPVVYYELFHVGFRRERLASYMNPWADPLKSGFQAIQGQLAFGGGGLTGYGLGEGRQKLLFLPEPHNDFIFCVIGEELGLVGSTIVLSLFAAFLFIGLNMARKSEDGFARGLIFGLTCMLGLQALINMGVATGLFPNKGMALPFVSYGGSALVIALMSVGMILSAARGSQAGAPQSCHARRA